MYKAQSEREGDCLGKLEAVLQLGGVKHIGVLGEKRSEKKIGSLGKVTEVWQGSKSCLPWLSCQFTNSLLGAVCQEDECCLVDSLAKELVQEADAAQKHFDA